MRARKTAGPAQNGVSGLTFLKGREKSKYWLWTVPVSMQIRM